ncbi:hypothetical protein C3942_06195 [Solimonas fluminis]|uniref:DUF3313 domain-containing protein n=1 Tax=Solimonas fluminis TaxID=2086571 RepID=A0A2S5TKE9_9GAMM|nr:hypothetical protein [Solimonas fluminis]PPE75258.1 hypothetical protein C3942_06195 [Solimonas fluminis]
MRTTSILAGSLALLAAALSGVAAAEETAAASATVSAPSALDPDAYFKGQTGGTFGKSVTSVLLPKTKRVAVAGFRVVFINYNTVSAQVRASYLPGRDTSGAKASMNVTLEGVDSATMQAITDKAYADFLAQLAAAGREVVPASELASFHAEVEPSAQPYEKEVAGAKGIAFAPSGTPLFFTYADFGWTDKTPFNQKSYRLLAPLSEKLQAIVVAPLIVVDFANMTSSGNRSGLMARDAEVGASLAMSVKSFYTPMIRAEESKMGMTSKGEEANATLQQAIVSDLAFGTLEQMEQTDNESTKKMFDMIGGFMGMANAGGAARKKSSNSAKTDSAAYSAAALDALGRSTATFAAWFQKYPAP